MQPGQDGLQAGRHGLCLLTRNVSLARTDFESIPLPLCTAVLTEEGAVAPRTMARRLAALPAARFLRRLARRRRPEPQGRAEPGRR